MWTALENCVQVCNVTVTVVDDDDADDDYESCVELKVYRNLSLSCK